MANIAAIRTVKHDSFMMSVFRAAIYTANEQGATIREIADQLGVSKSSLHRWIQRERDRRTRNPWAIPVYTPAADGSCNHRLLDVPGRRFCLQCCMSNFEKDPALRRTRATDPRPEPVVEVPRPKVTRRQRRKQQAVA